MRMQESVKRFTHDEAGQTMAEYSIVVAAIVVGVIVAIGFFGLAVSGRIGSIADAIGLLH